MTKYVIKNGYINSKLLGSVRYKIKREAIRLGYKDYIDVLSHVIVLTLDYFSSVMMEISSKIIDLHKREHLEKVANDIKNNHRSTGMYYPEVIFMNVKHNLTTLQARKVLEHEFCHHLTYKINKTLKHNKDFWD